MTTVKLIQQALRDQSDPIKADFFPHFFKLEPGDKDEFLGVTVPKQRTIVKEFYRQISSEEVAQLLHSTVHEERLTALMIWVLQCQKGTEEQKKDIYNLYLKNTKWINNWDLVDASCRDIVGVFLEDKDRSILDTLSHSANIWERRIAIVCTWYFIRLGDFEWTLRLAEQYLTDNHHYIHKATGWMLREVGKRDRQVLVDFLEAHAAQMPRTALRYAIEHFDKDTRQHFMTLKLTN